MNKSVYSLVLMDRLVEEVDRLAYLRGTSRSNLINQLLAESLSLVTPEKRMQEMFSHIQSTINALDGLAVCLQPSDSRLAIKSSLRYKYNPTIRYHLVLYREPTDAFGELRVFFRTQNPSLLARLTDFFVFWCQLERKVQNRSISYEVSPGKLVRPLAMPKNPTPETLADATTQYIALFDAALKQYFESPTHTNEIVGQYLNYVNQNSIIV